MANSYYPEYYLRKKQRDRFYRRLTTVFVGIAIAGVLGAFVGVLLFKYVIQKPSTEPGVSADMAVQRSDLEMQEALAGTPSQRDSNAMDEGALGSLAQADIGSMDYAQSFPQTQVTLEGTESSGIGDSMTPDDSTAVTTGTESTEQSSGNGNNAEQGSIPAGERARDESFTRDDGSGSEEVDTRSGDSTQPQATSEPEVSEAQTGQDGESSAEADTPGDEVSTGATSGIVWRVYAGSFLSRDAAERRKNDLVELGLKGTVIQSGGDYLLRIAELNDAENAKALHNKLADSGFPAAFVTRVAQ